MDLQQEWQRYKDAWARGRTLAMDVDTFNALFFDGSISAEAVKLLNSSSASAVRATLEPLVSLSSPQLIGGLSDHDRLRVWLEVLRADQDHEYDRLMLQGREALPASTRERLVSILAKAATENLGRQRVRAMLGRWWREGGLIEEEQESLLTTLAHSGVLNAQILRDLGSNALTVANRLARSGRVSPDVVQDFDFTLPPAVQASRPGNSLVPRISALLQPVLMDLDIRDAGLHAGELAGLAPNGASAALGYATLLDQTLRRLERHLPHPELHDLAAGLSEFGRLLTVSRPDLRASGMRFPLIRLLHLRLLLESPSLSSALTSPEEALVPEVLSFTLGRDTVAYSPELRVWRDTDKRWRARWAESAGEAMSVMFLESALGLDLTTLSRIPERSDMRTPDFQAATLRDEPIVFESKGATSWKTHLQQRGAALEQLGKGGPSPGSPGFSMPNRGRAFAMALFAAQQGDMKSSLLHVEDPPFPFEQLFREGWQDSARRSHYAAVLESARLDGAAAAWRQGRPFNPEIDGLELFDFGRQEPESHGSYFLGTHLPTKELARSLRHPDMESVSALRIFVGVRNDVFDALRENRMPPWQQIRDGPNSNQPGGPKSPMPRWGLLPGSEPGRPARGVYSALEDGSLLAVELA